MTLKNKFTKGKLLSALSAIACLVVTYIVIQHPSPSFGTWVSGLPAALIVAVTALVRGNEIPVEVDSWRSHMRRAGFFFAGIGAISFMISPLKGFWPGWNAWFMVWGIACAWLTTPNMPPWWNYITGQKKLLRKDVV